MALDSSFHKAVNHQTINYWPPGFFSSRMASKMETANRTVTVMNPLLWSIYIAARSLVVDRGELDTPAKTCIQSERPRVIADLITRPLITAIISDRYREICWLTHRWIRMVEHRKTRTKHLLLLILFSPTNTCRSRLRSHVFIN